MNRVSLLPRPQSGMGFVQQQQWHAPVLESEVMQREFKFLASTQRKKMNTEQEQIPTVIAPRPSH
jgi:hypothetical protein